MTSGLIALPSAEIHSIIDTQAREPGSFFRTAVAFAMPKTRPLVALPSIIPVSCMLYLLACWMSLISGMLSNLNHDLTTSMVAPSTRRESIRQLFWTLNDGYLLIKASIYLLPKGLLSPLPSQNSLSEFSDLLMGWCNTQGMLNSKPLG